MADRLVAIVGPTGIGKSRLALKLAIRFNGEIVSADSRQVYRGLDIGTDKPAVEERALVPHHLIDVVEPGEDFSLAEYQRLAGEAISDILGRGRLPLLVGGSGLYVWAVLEGWQVPPVPPDPGLRRQLRARAEEQGSAALYDELRAVAPGAAARIDPRNVRRVIRALEVHRAPAGPSGGPGKRPPPFRWLALGLTAPRPEVYRRTDARVDAMFRRGLVDEVRGLLAKGYGPERPALSGIGYRQVVAFLQGETSLAGAIARVKTETHRLVRHQYAWFRPGDERIHWLDITTDFESEAERLVASFLGGE